MTTNHASRIRELTTRLEAVGLDLANAADHVEDDQRRVRRVLDSLQIGRAASELRRGRLTAYEAEAWAEAGEALVRVYERHDMEAVHRERAERRSDDRA